MVSIARPLLLAGILSALIAACSTILPIGNVDIGLGLNVNGNGKPKPETQCDSTEVMCTCGIGGRSIFITVPQCAYTNRWKTKCKPCDKMEEKDVCPKFQNCLQCHLNGGNQCASCPPGKFGNWCENDCLCDNGGDCDRSGRCLCLPGFEGLRCERRKGCPVPQLVAPPLQENRQPPNNPTTIVYSCPTDYVLRGPPAITCLPEGQWSGAPPVCLRKCPFLSEPSNGRLEYISNELVEGTSVTVRCNDNFQLVGGSTIHCLQGGVWSSGLPLCKRLTSCPDPESAAHSTRTVESPNALQTGPFLEGTKIHYRCLEDYEQMGTDTITCLSDGKWSNQPVTCLKVSHISPDCLTHGEDIVAEIGVPVRIMCPPECANGAPLLWGTSIYKQESAVCPAAVHSGIVTNSGGLVDVINNGEYSYFVGSALNNVRSQSSDDRDVSFRFNKVPPLVISKDREDCPQKLLRLQKSCVYASNNRRNKREAEAVCKNLDLHLSFPETDDERKNLFAVLNEKGITQIWTDKAASNTQSLQNSCETASSPGANAVTVETADCQLKMNFVCAYGSNIRALASCEDQGILTNGKANAVGKIGDVFYVGSSIEYSCDSLHYMKGKSIVFCSSNGTWSAPKPTCTRLSTCEAPPAPIGGKVIYMPPLQSGGTQRSADVRSSIVASRVARIPAGLAAPVPAPRNGGNSPEEETENIELPAGVYRVGTRAVYDCESRYYQLVGSRTRRCESRGNWSGRPPTCIPVCGRSDSPRSPFVLNGNASDIGQWPWQAAIARWLPDYSRWFVLCGASLLNERWVITAAHCVTYAASTLPIDPDKFQVYLGKYHREDSKDDEYVQVKKVHEIHIHPDYDPNLFDADIALLQLETAVRLNSRVQPVCLPTEQTTRENLKEGKQGVVTGWGMTENETYAETLQQAVLPMVSHSTCEKGYRDSDLPLTITDNMYCAGFAQGRTDACSGDSGGPMVFVDESAKERRWVLEGIVSWGSPSGCGHANQYGGFTTVSRFLNWIHLFF